MTAITDFQKTVTIENCVLGAILQFGGAIDLIYEDLFPECFLLKENADIYLAMQTLKKENTPIDFITISDELKKQGTYTNIGASYLTNLTNYIFSSTNVEYHARILLQRYVEREIEKIGKTKTDDPLKNFLDAKNKVADLENKIGKKTNTKHISNALSKSLKEMEERMMNAQTNQCVGISSGIRELDKVLNGWQPARVYVIAARPGMGKTTISLQFAKEALMKGKSVMFFSLEMSETELSNKLILGMTDVSKSKFDNGFLSKYEANSIADVARIISKWNFHIDDTAGISMSAIKSKAKEYKEMGLCDMVIIDYLQLCEEKGLKGRTREQEVSAMSRDAKIIAKDLNVPVLLLSQLSRKVEERKDSEPQLSDLRDSGAIEQDADVVMFIYRPKYYDIETIKGISTENYGEFLIEKNRHGRCARVQFQHNDEFTQFYDYGSI